MLDDLRFALRSLRSNPAFAVVAILTLGLGIGATTTMFSVVYGVLVRPLPYPQPQRIVEVAQTYRGDRAPLWVTYPEFRFLDEHRSPFQYLTATTSVGLNLFAGGLAEHVDALCVSQDYFRVLGVSPELGREFTTEEDQPAGPSVVIISHGLWVRHFGSDPAIVGQTIRVDGRPATIVGVMPADFQELQDPGVDLWSTLAQVVRSVGAGENLQVIGRLEPGVTVAGARGALQALTASYRTEFQGHPLPDRLDLLAYQDLMGAAVGRPVGILFGAIVFVLLIACAKVANLELGRAVAREREVAVRVALGAGRGRVIRLILAETALLALFGGALGLLFAYAGMNGVLAILPSGLPRATAIHLDRWALVFTLGLSLVTGVAFGLLPAWRVTRADVQEVLKGGDNRATQSGRRGRLRSALVTVEIALSLVLLVGAALLVRTFGNLIRDDVGFSTDHLLTAEIWLDGTRYDSTAQISAFYDRLTNTLHAVPGVRSAGVVEAGLPLQRGGFMGYVRLDGAVLQSRVEYRTSTPDYLGVLGVPLVQGRMLSTTDNATAEPVAVVNRAFAHQFLADSDAIGHIVILGNGSARRIVGVVGDVKSFIGEAALPDVFITSAQTPAGMTRLFSTWYPIHVVLRTTVDPGKLNDAVARTIHEADPTVPVGRMRSMDEVQGGALALQRFIMLLASVFAALAVALAAVGIYGVMSYFAAARVHEIGVRMALGALPGNVVGLVLRRGMVLVLVGVVLGIAGALALSRVLSSALYHVTATDPPTFAAVTALLAGVAFAACYVPARRAAHADPVEALRSE